MTSKTPFNKDNGTKISFEQLVELIGTTSAFQPRKHGSENQQYLLVYEKQIDLDFYYVEEIRSGKKSLAFQTLYKRASKNPSE